ncbi:hypothetical protein KEM55_008441 [Ascosphaera atra]|nr:hypothetical protein KEM55_008441 [Ascosphaera atra]
MLLSEDGLRTIKDCHKAFRLAGADIISTGTYQISKEGFARTPNPPTIYGSDVPEDQATYGLKKEEIKAALRKGIDVAVEARDEVSPKKTSNSNAGGVALSLGPYGACMIPGQEYGGNYDVGHRSEEALFAWHLERLKLFIEAATEAEGTGSALSRLQYIAFETIPVLNEIRAIRRALQAAGLENIPFWLSCVFPNEDPNLPDGSLIAEAVRAMFEGPGARPFGIGINCTKIHKLPLLVPQYEGAVGTLIAEGIIDKAPTLLLYPDGTNGEVYNTVTQQWERRSHPGDDTRSWEEQFAAIVTQTRAKGMFSHFILGGCCKAAPAEIGKLSAQFYPQA